MNWWYWLIWLDLSLRFFNWCTKEKYKKIHCPVHSWWPAGMTLDLNHFFPFFMMKLMSHACEVLAVPWYFFSKSLGRFFCRHTKFETLPLQFGKAHQNQRNKTDKNKREAFVVLLFLMISCFCNMIRRFFFDDLLDSETSFFLFFFTFTDWFQEEAYYCAGRFIHPRIALIMPWSRCTRV